MSNSNYNIANKIFTYVKHGADITPTIADLYNSSLIFIGDEQQIYVPIMNTYVGVGKSKYDELAKSALWTLGEGLNSITSKYGDNRSLGEYSVSFGKDNRAIGNYSTALGESTTTVGIASISEGSRTIAEGDYSHSEGYETLSSGTNSHSEGSGTIASGISSHSEGQNTTASGDFSHSEGFNSSAIGNYSHSEGQGTVANADWTHAEGYKSEALGQYSHAEGNNTYSRGVDSHSEGYKSEAIGDYSHAEGNNTYANGNNSHAEGYQTETNNNGEHAEGRYNLSHKSSNTFGSGNNTTFSHGIGTSTSNRKNALEIMENGNAYLINVGDFDGTNITSSVTLQSVINRAISSTNTGSVDNSGLHVINNVHINSYGDLSYTYHDLSGSDSDDFLTGFTQTADGKVSVSTGVFRTSAHEQTTEQDYVITYTYINSAGTIHYNYRDLTGSDSGNFLTGFSQSKDGKISVSKGTFTNTEHEKTTEQNHVITYTYIDSNGQIHADYRDLSGSDSSDFLTGFTQTKDGKISVTGGVFTYASHKQTTEQDYVLTYTYITPTGKLHFSYRDISGSDSGNFLTGFSQTKDGKISVTKGTFTNTYLETSRTNLISGDQKVVTYTYIDTVGNVHYTYNNIYVDPENDFKYHDLGITQVTYQGDENFVYALTGVSTSNGNATSHTISYQISGLPTKKYVDDQFRANDALRYCGTVSAATTSGGIGTFTHNTVHPGHESPDYSAGAVYKVTGTGYFGTERVSAGDMIISYSDTADNSSVTGWNVINQNIDLRTLTPTQVYNGGSKSSNVLTNVDLTADGTLSYTYYPLEVTNNTPTLQTASVETFSTMQNILKSNAEAGFKVLTGVSLTQDGLNTKLSSTFTYLYTERKHHSGSKTQANGFLYSVSLSDEGVLSGEGRDFAYEGVTTSNATILANSYTNIVTGISLGADGKLSYSYTPLNIGSSVGLDSVVHGNSSVTGVLTGLYVDSTNSNKLTYLTEDLSNSTYTGDFAISYSQTPTGKVTVSFGTFGTNTGVKNSYTSYISGVSLGSNGHITYNYAEVNHTNSGSEGLNSDNNARVITNVGLSKAGAFTYNYKNLTVDTASSQNSLSLSAKTNDKDATNILRTSTANTGIKVLTGATLTQSGTETKLSYEYTDIYANLSHHSGSINQSSGFVYSITMGADGALSASGRNFTNTGTKSDNTVVNNFEIDFINNVNLSSTGELSYTYGTVSFGITYQVKNVINTSSRIYLSGSTSNVTDNISYQYFSLNTYTDNGSLFTSSAIVGGNTILGSAGTDSVTLRSKSIVITNETGNTDSITVTNLSKLWGTI